VPCCAVAVKTTIDAGTRRKSSIASVICREVGERRYLWHNEINR
jgi:hypothetical protein